MSAMRVITMLVVMAVITLFVIVLVRADRL